MISTTTVVREIIKNSPFLEEGLLKGIISYSALARNIRPLIEKKLMKEVGRGSIVMALQRITHDLHNKKISISNVHMLGDLTVRSNLSKVSYLNSDTIVEKYSKLFSLVGTRKDIFCNISQGVRAVMVIVSDGIESEFEQIFFGEKLLAKVANLSSITIRFPQDIDAIPGVYYSLLKILAWEGITISEVISTYMEFTIIISDEDIDRAFSILKNYKQSLI